MANLNSLNSNESTKSSSKTANFIENTKRAIHKAITTTGIVVSSFLPTSLNTITTAPVLTGTTITKTIGIGTAASLLAACSKDSDELDTTPPTITLKQSEIDVTGGKVISISKNQLLIGDKIVASWTDNASKNCTVKLSMNGNPVTSGETLNKKGTLSITITDEAGNSKNSSIKLNIINNAPEILAHKEKVDIDEGKTISVDGNKLTIGDETVVSWTDDNTEKCGISLKFNDKKIESGSIIKDEGTLSITVTDEEGLSSSTNITLFINNGAPEISILQSEVDVSKGKTITRKGNQLLLGDNAIVSWTDDNTENCSLSLKFNDEEIKTGASIRTAGTLEITVTDKDGKSSSVNIKLTINNTAPHITLNQSSVNIFGGARITISNNQLIIGDKIVASRNDDRTDNCKVSLKFNGTEITSGSTIDTAGKLELTITDEDEISSKESISLTNDSIYGLENLRNLTIQVDKEVDIMKGITFADGIQLQQISIEMDGKTTILNAPYHFTAQYPGKCTIIISMKGPNGKTFEEKITKNISPLEYKSITINSLKPVDILPIIGQINQGDIEAYNHIEHLRVAEATKIRDMMRKYGAGSHSPEQYQQLMSRLHTGMTQEYPIGYNNYETIGGEPRKEASNHAHDERNILNTLLNHCNFEIAYNNHRDNTLYTLASNNPDHIYIFGNSAYVQVDTNKYIKQEWDDLKKAGKLPNFIIRISGSNIQTENGILKNKIFQQDIEPDPSCVYGLPSYADGKNHSQATSHILVTIGTNAQGNVDQSNGLGGSRFPIGFHPDVLFSGRTFPYSDTAGNIIGKAGKYATSYTNYVNLAMCDLCFQMFAEVKDVNDLLNMIRSSSLTDYISLDGQTQKLQLINPAGFFQKYLMPTKLPSQINVGEYISLNKGYYKGIIFDIPGAEVKINGKWVAYNDTNKSQIKNQNPFTLEWRLNGDLCKKYGYSSSKPIKGNIIPVDDKFNGLNIHSNISITPSF